jgi:hypothetical protein
MTGGNFRWEIRAALGNFEKAVTKKKTVIGSN